MTGPLIPQTYREQVADQLREDILVGRLQPQDPLVERTLATQFGVSTIPVREALMQLVGEGFLQHSAHRGVRVIEQNEALRDLFFRLRIGLELHAADVVVDDPPSEFLAKVQQSVRGLKEACRKRDLETVVVEEYSLHRLLMSQAAIPELLITWRTTIARTPLVRPGAKFSLTVLRTLGRQHEAILKGLRQRDRETVRKALQENLEFESSV